MDGEKGKVVKVFRRKTKIRLIGTGVAILLILVCAGVFVTSKINVNADESGAGTGGYNNTACGNLPHCRDEEILGTFWIRVPIIAGMDRYISTIANGGRGYLFGKKDPVSAEQKIHDPYAVITRSDEAFGATPYRNDRKIKCKVGDYAYILSSVWYENVDGGHPNANSDGKISMIVAAVDMDEMGTKFNPARPSRFSIDESTAGWVYGGPGWNSSRYKTQQRVINWVNNKIDKGSNIKVVDEYVARNAFKEIEATSGSVRDDVTGTRHYYENYDESGSSLGYFCGGSGEGETKTRIAVQNMSVDGATDPKSNYLTAKSLSGTNKYNDSKWTTENKTARVLAKPSDTIRFYHGIQRGAFFDERINEVKNAFKVSSAYHFETNWTKENTEKTITKNNEKYEFINPSSDSKYQCDRYDSNNNLYTSDYWMKNYVSGGFQIPGFEKNGNISQYENAARYCGYKDGDKYVSKYADKLNQEDQKIPLNLVGQTIVQQHNYNPLAYKNGKISGTYSNDASLTAWKNAIVYVPYNFKTSVSLEVLSKKNKNRGYIYTDELMQMNYHWRVETRENPVVSPNKPNYSTVTPSKTQVVSFEWVRVPGTPSANDLKGNVNSKVGPEEYYKSGMVPNTYKVVKSYSGAQNSEGYLNGSNYYSLQTSIGASSEYTGYEVCTAIAIYPSESHNYKGNGFDVQVGDAMSGGNTWNISNAVCRTIAKKPSFQVWNGSIYTEGEINTSTTELGGRRFGSWADYSIIAGKNNNQMASGAMFGYGSLAYSFPSGGMDEKSSDENTLAKMASPQTISNTSSPTGNSNINTSSSYHQTLSRLE